MSANAEVVRGIYDALSKGDVPSVLGAFDPKIEWQEAESFLYADGNPYVGPRSVAEGVFQRVVGDVDRFAAVPSRLIDGGDTVVVEGRYKGNMKSTGTSLDAQFVHVWDLRQQRVVRFQQYTDTAQWTRAATAC